MDDFFEFRESHGPVRMGEIVDFLVSESRKRLEGEMEEVSLRGLGRRIRKRADYYHQKAEKTTFSDKAIAASAVSVALMEVAEQIDAMLDEHNMVGADKE